MRWHGKSKYAMRASDALWQSGFLICLQESAVSAPALWLSAAMHASANRTKVFGRFAKVRCGELDIRAWVTVKLVYNVYLILSLVIVILIIL